MDFVKYYPNVIERDVCALIVEELKEVTPLEGPTGSTRINGLDCISLKIDSDNFTFPLLAKAIKKIKANYIDEYPRYKNFLNYSSGEFYEVFEDIGSKLLIQHYPENGFMKELEVNMLINNLDLRRPIYKQTAAYGHFGRNDLSLPWEQTDKAELLKAEAGIS